jgi:hypothetical protein
MPISIKPPLIQSFVLEECDKLFENTGAPTTIKVRQASQGEEEERNSLFALTEKRFKADGDVSYHTHVSIDDVWREEVWLTMADCNITNDLTGDQLFTFNGNRLSSKEAFLKAWRQLDVRMAQEIIKKVHEANIQWGPQGNA